MKKFCLAVLLASPFFAVSVQADSYFGIDGTGFFFNAGESDEVNPRGARVKLGVQLTEHIDIEAQLGGGTDSETEEFDRFSTVFAGVYTKLFMPLGHRSALFATMGLASIELTQTINDSQFSDTRASFAYGVGLETMLSDRVDLTADYTWFTSDETAFDNLSTVSIGLKWYL